MSYVHRSQQQQNAAAGVEAEDRKKMAEARKVAAAGKCPSCGCQRYPNKEPHKRDCKTRDESAYNEARIASLDRDIERRYKEARTVNVKR